MVPASPPTQPTPERGVPEAVAPDTHSGPGARVNHTAGRPPDVGSEPGACRRRAPAAGGGRPTRAVQATTPRTLRRAAEPAATAAPAVGATPPWCQGRRAQHRDGRRLAVAGLTVVSGLARGEPRADPQAGPAPVAKRWMGDSIDSPTRHRLPERRVGPREFHRPSDRAQMTGTTGSTIHRRYDRRHLRDHLERRARVSRPHHRGSVH